MQKKTDLNKTRRAQSARKMSIIPQSHKDLFTTKIYKQDTIQSHVDQIMQHLIKIIQALLQQQSSNNYIDFMKKVSQMLIQNEKKMMNTLVQKISQVRSQLLQTINKPKQQQLSIKSNQFNQLKEERKIMTQKFISFNRTNSMHSDGKVKSKESNNDINQEQIMEINSLEINSINHKITALEEESSKSLKQFYKSLQMKIDQNYKDIKLLTQKNIAFRLNMQEKLDISLQSIWNVIGETQNKIMNLEQKINL